jgi:hypothetical protein
MTSAEREQIKEEIRRYEAMIANDPNGKEANNWRQRVANLKAALRG